MNSCKPQRTSGNPPKANNSLHLILRPCQNPGPRSGFIPKVKGISALLFNYHTDNSQYCQLCRFASTLSTAFSICACNTFEPCPPKAAMTAFSTYLPTMSTSTFTRSPTALLARSIFVWVCAMSITPNVRSESPTVVTVNDAPSSVTKPFSMR